MIPETLSYDDVLIRPKFSTVNSRKDVDLTSFGLKLPIISSNMDTVYSTKLAVAMAEAGGVACIHRFMSIDDNIKAFKETEVKPWVSIGVGEKELERAIALYNSGAEIFVIDVAHGASTAVAAQVIELRKLYDNIKIVVGNFGEGYEVRDFHHYLKQQGYKVDAYKVGIGGGSACTTRIKTGCGVPSFHAIMSASGVSTGVPIIADGGIRTPGDIAKALGAGASAVMLGGMIAGTEETPGDIVQQGGEPIFHNILDLMISSGKAYKKYRGSASQESYEAQGKDESWRTAEGESFYIKYKGPVKLILQDIEGGLRSAFAYTNSKTIKEFHNNVDFIKVTNSGLKESGAHGKT